MSLDYSSFLASKRLTVPDVGIDVDPTTLHFGMKDHQRAVCAWAIRKGRAAVWLETGQGKSLVGLEWARVLGKRTLWLAPLGAAQQLVTSEAPKWGIACAYAKSEADASPTGITVTNYERLDRFDLAKWGAVVLDEASILAAFTGTIKRALITRCRQVDYRLTLTATPAPNDTVELCNQADFLSVMPQQEMLSRFFTPKGVEGSATGQYRLKTHARRDFFRWLSTWAIACKLPSDLGFSDEGYVLPPLRIVPHFVETDWRPAGQLLATKLKGVTDRAAVRRDTMAERVRETVKIIEASWNQNSSSTSGNATSGNATTSSPQPKREATHGLPLNGSSASNTTATTTLAPENSSAQSKTPSAPPARRRKLSGSANNDASTTSLIGSASSLSQRHPDSAIPPSERTVISSVSTESPSSTTNGDSRSSEDAAPSADARAASGVMGSMLTTITGPEQSEDSSARTAIALSDSSRTTDAVSLELPNTSHKKLEQWVVWCGLNEEQDAVAKALGDRCVSVYGSLDPDEKVRRERLWREGHVPVLVTKAKILGFGLNWQHCSRMIFCGLSDSWQTYYQAIRRCHRYGNPRSVHAHIVLSEPERAVYENVLRKEREASDMTRELVAAMRDFEQYALTGKQDVSDPYEPTTVGQWAPWILERAHVA